MLPFGTKRVQWEVTGLSCDGMFLCECLNLRCELVKPTVASRHVLVCSSFVPVTCIVYCVFR